MHFSTRASANTEQSSFVRAGVHLDYIYLGSIRRPDVHRYLKARQARNGPISPERLVRYLDGNGKRKRLLVCPEPIKTFEYPWTPTISDCLGSRAPTDVMNEDRAIDRLRT